MPSKPNEQEMGPESLEEGFAPVPIVYGEPEPAPEDDDFEEASESLQQEDPETEEGFEPVPVGTEEPQPAPEDDDFEEVPESLPQEDPEAEEGFEPVPVGTEEPQPAPEDDDFEEVPESLPQEDPEAEDGFEPVPIGTEEAPAEEEEAYEDLPQEDPEAEEGFEPVPIGTEETPAEETPEEDYAALPQDETPDLSPDDFMTDEQLDGALKNGAFSGEPAQEETPEQDAAKEDLKPDDFMTDEQLDGALKNGAFASQPQDGNLNQTVPEPQKPISKPNALERIGDGFLRIFGSRNEHCKQYDAQQEMQTIQTVAAAKAKSGSSDQPNPDVKLDDVDMEKVKETMAKIQQGQVPSMNELQALAKMGMRYMEPQTGKSGKEIMDQTGKSQSEKAAEGWKNMLPKEKDEKSEPETEELEPVKAPKSKGKSTKYFEKFGEAGANLSGKLMEGLGKLTEYVFGKNMVSAILNSGFQVIAAAAMAAFSLLGTVLQGSSDIVKGTFKGLGAGFRLTGHFFEKKSKGKTADEPEKAEKTKDTPEKKDKTNGAPEKKADEKTKGLEDPVKKDLTKHVDKLHDEANDLFEQAITSKADAPKSEQTEGPKADGKMVPPLGAKNVASIVAFHSVTQGIENKNWAMMQSLQTPEAGQQMIDRLAMSKNVQYVGNHPHSAEFLKKNLMTKEGLDELTAKAIQENHELTESVFGEEAVQEYMHDVQQTNDYMEAAYGDQAPLLGGSGEKSHDLIDLNEEPVVQQGTAPQPKELPVEHVNDSWIVKEEPKTEEPKVTTRPRSNAVYSKEGPQAAKKELPSWELPKGAKSVGSYLYTEPLTGLTMVRPDVDQKKGTEALQKLGETKQHAAQEKELQKKLGATMQHKSLKNPVVQSPEMNPGLGMK